MPPPQLRDYTFVRHLASGGYSEVFEYRATRLERPVAVKVLTEETADSEAKLMATVSRHPSIVDVYDTGVTDDGHRYLVMRLFHGNSYAEIIRSSGPLPVDEVLRVGILMAGAIQFAHDHGILHRDIKPANILVDRDGVPHLLDFGIARLMSQQSATATGTRALTPRYAAPEQVAVQRLAVHVLHDQVGDAAGAFAGIQQAHDVGMHQARQDLALGEEAAAPVGVVARSIDDLDRHLAVEAAVRALGQQHAAHATAANLAQHAVAALAAQVIRQRLIRRGMGVQPGPGAGGEHLHQFVDQVWITRAQRIQFLRAARAIQRMQPVEGRAQAAVARRLAARRVYRCSVFSSHARALSHLRLTALGWRSSAAAVCSMVSPRK